MLNVEIIATSELGDRSYIIHDGTFAVIIDPQRDIDRVQSLLDNANVTAKLVLETHIHNDYVSGGLALARTTGARYGLTDEVIVSFEHDGLHDGDRLECGSLGIEVIATPGHTTNHLAFLVSDELGRRVLFSGGSLLYGSVGRTDLLGASLTVELTHAQYQSAHRLAAMLEDDVPLYPTHGFGSFCSSGETSGDESSTMGIERRRNDALTEADEEAFVRRLIAGLGAFPSYYAHMAPLNLAGPVSPELDDVATVDADTLAERIRAGEWVIDLRNQRAFALHHLAGTVSMGIGNNFSTYVGWLIPWDSPITLIGEDGSQVREAHRQLVRIGIDLLRGAASGPVEALASTIELRAYPVSSFSQLPPLDQITLLDVRRDDERATGYIVGSLHIPLQDLNDRMNELPETTLWVHCASGYRASIATSLLERSGHRVVLVDDDFSAVAKLSIPVAS